MSTAAAIVPSTRRTTGWMLAAFNLAAGLGVTLLLMTGLSRMQKPSLAPPQAVTDDLRSVDLPLEPPTPPAAEPIEGAPDPLPVSNLIQLEGGRTESAVKLAVLPEMPETVPPIAGVPQIDFAVTASRPTGVDQEVENRRVFASEQVDQRCVPVLKVKPQVTSELLRAARRREVAFLFIVNRDGKVEHVWLASSTGNPQLDEISQQAIRQWRFSPAMRQGRKVRQWVRQSIEFHLPARSPFEIR